MRLDSIPMVWHPDYVCSLPEGHRFPMAKFAFLHTALHADGTSDYARFVAPAPLDLDVLQLVHDPNYICEWSLCRLDPKAVRVAGLPNTAEVVHRTLAEVAGTLTAARLALRYGVACNLAGGTHHAFADRGTGFCLINDVAVCAAAMIAEGLCSRVAIIDLDVHQGDGTAALMRNRRDVFTFSMHCRQNFPFRRQQSDLDVEVEAGTGDNHYFDALTEHIPYIFDRFAPDFVIYDAGADPFEGDALGKLALSHRGLFRRDEYVLEECRRRHIPVMGVIGGGYDKNLEALAHRHAWLHRAATSVYCGRTLHDSLFYHGVNNAV